MQGVQARLAGAMSPRPAQDGRLASPTYADHAYARLEEMIVTLEFRPGSLLTEASLSELLGVGRTPVREALQRLEAEHLVKVMPRRGILVSELHIEQQLLALDVRRELERLVAARAARRSTRQERDRLAEMADEMTAATEANDEIAFLRLDHEFDERLIAGARNAYLASALSPLHAVSRRFWYAHRSHMRDMRLMGTVHSDVLRAVSASDERAAAAAADRMMDFVDDYTRATLEEL